MADQYLVPVTVLIILVGAVTAGPVFGLPPTSPDASCTGDSPIGTGQASVAVTHLPDSAILERSRFGADGWRLMVDAARVDVRSVSGQPTLTYKLRVRGDDLSFAEATTVILSECKDTSRLEIADRQLSPRTLDQETYAGTISVTYRASQGGDTLERKLATKNITVTINR